MSWRGGWRGGGEKGKVSWRGGWRGAGEESEGDVVRRKRGEEEVVGWRRESKNVIYEQPWGSLPFGSPATRSVVIQNCRGEGERYKCLAHCTIQNCRGEGERYKCLAHCTIPTVSYTPAYMQPKPDQTVPKLGMEFENGVCISVTPYVVVPDRNRILFCCVFWAHHWVWCAITSAKGGAHTCYVNTWISDASTKHIWAPSLAEA